MPKPLAAWGRERIRTPYLEKCNHLDLIRNEKEVMGKTESRIRENQMMDLPIDMGKRWQRRDSVGCRMLLGERPMEQEQKDKNWR